MTAAGGDYDVIVVDRMLPGVDGLAIVKMIRSAGLSPPSVPDSSWRHR